jgi:hypothetical protein
MNAGAGLCPALALRLCGGRLPITLLRRRPQRTLGPLLDGGIEQRVALAIPAVAFPPPWFSGTTFIGWLHTGHAFRIGYTTAIQISLLRQRHGFSSGAAA